jgi:hypothetical protein
MVGREPEMAEVLTKNKVGRPPTETPSRRQQSEVEKLRSKGVTERDIAERMGLTVRQFAARFGQRPGPRGTAIMKWLSKAFTTDTRITPTGLSVVMGKSKTAAHRIIVRAVKKGILKADTRESGYARFYALTDAGETEVSEFRNQ